MGGVPQREADLLHLQIAVERAQGSQKEAAMQRLQAEIAARATADLSVRQAVAALLRTAPVQSILQVCVLPFLAQAAVLADTIDDTFG